LIAWAGNPLTLLVELDRLARIFGNVTKKTADFCGFEGHLSQKIEKCHALVTEKTAEIRPFLYINLNVMIFIYI
jgi:hypothetical protein